jgi:hypothetical protein
MTRAQSRTPKRRKLRSSLPSQAADREHIDSILDEALQDTFPCSDPVAIGGDPVRDDASSKRR